MRRREFIAGLGSATAWPVVARAQQPAMPVIGYLGSQSADDEYKNFTVPFLQGLKEAGFVEGQNVAMEYRWAGNQYDRLPALAADLVRYFLRKRTLPRRPERRLGLDQRICSAARRRAPALFDHLVRTQHYRWWYREPERRGGLAVQDHLELGRKLHGEIARLHAA